MQFCREWGWQKRFGYFNGRPRWEYVCRECCPTIEEARKEWLPGPPPSPPGFRRIDHRNLGTSPPPDTSPPPSQYKYGI